MSVLRMRHKGDNCFSFHLTGLYPSDDLEAGKCDAVLESAVDVYINMRPAYQEKDQAKKV